MAIPPWSDPALVLVCLSLALGAAGCGQGAHDSRASLPAESTLHLEDHLDAAVIAGSEIPDDVPAPIEWSFDEPQPGWQPLRHFNPTIPAPGIEQVEGALRVSLDERHADPRAPRLHGDVYVELPDLTRGEWSHVLIRARASEAMEELDIGFNLSSSTDEVDPDFGPGQYWGDRATVVNDGTVQTYRLRADHHASPGEWQGPWRQLILAFDAREPSTIDILSITLVPKAEVYADAPAAVRSVEFGNRYRRAVYVHTPASLQYRLRVPEGGRLDFGTGVIRDDVPVTFKVSVVGEGRDAENLFAESFADPGNWWQRSVDLSDYAGYEITLALEADASVTGTVAFWGAPTVGGSSGSEKPNVIFYVIDGGAADQMSLYGYNRSTTPNIDRLARDGVVFEYAYSNAGWSKPSTTSFMTSLQNSVLGNTRDRFDPLPVEARTMAERFHEGGYRTGVFVSNPWAGSFSSLQRGVDVFRDEGTDPHGTSSVELHQGFRSWRTAYPGAPYWAHFQTTDVHYDHHPVAPFAGLFATPELRTQYDRWKERMDEWARENPAPFWVRFRKVWDATDIDRVEYHDAMRALYDESMAHQDYQLGRFVQRLKDEGEWENTILVIASDHSLDAGTWDFVWFGQDSLPRPWNWSLLRSSVSHVPLIFIWPGHIAGDRVIRHPVSMIDVLPTLLDLSGLPMPEALQGQSLAPLLLERDGWQPRPVIFDQFETDRKSGELLGTVEVIDGRWGASLMIGPDPEEGGEETEWRRRPDRLLLYDVWNDPFALTPVNEEQPELVERYRAFLEEQWAAHRALAQHFTPGADTELTPEQLETLRSLGYIQ